MASISQIPAIAEATQELAGQLVRAEIPAAESQYMLRSALALAALNQCKGNRRRASRYLGLPLHKFNDWLRELHLEETAKRIRRACASQMALRLKAKPSAPAQSFPVIDPQEMLRPKALSG